MARNINVTISVDEEKIKRTSKNKNLEAAISDALEQLTAGGMKITSWAFAEEPTVDITVWMDVSDKEKIFGARQILTMDTIKTKDIKTAVATILENHTGMNTKNLVFTDNEEKEIIASVTVSKEDIRYNTGRMSIKDAINEALEWLYEECAITFNWFWAGQEPDFIQKLLNEQHGTMIGKLEMNTNEKCRSVVTINGKQYKVRLLTGDNYPDVPNEWDMLMDAFQEDNEKLHWEDMMSWCREKINGEYRVRRGYISARYWDYNGSSSQNAYVGFRPVLEPIEKDILNPVEDGTILQFGTLYMDGKALHNPQNPVSTGDIPNYMQNATLQIGETSPGEREQIRWVKWRNLLVADRNILKNISWDQLNALGFTEE